MSTIKVTNIQNPNSGTNDIIIDAGGNVDIGGFSADASAPVNSVNLDSSGRLLVGTSSTSATAVAVFQGASGDPSNLYLQRPTATPADGNSLGQIFFADNAAGAAARIIGQRDGGTWTSGSSHPGRLVFSTTVSGNSSPTERMRISSTGKLTVPGVYSGTTTGGGPVYVESDGDLLRYTSSRKYKTDIETLEDKRADAILNCRPVWYRSLSPNDIKTEGAEKSDWGWYGFIAEEVAEVEPRLVNWATKDAVVQEDGSVQSVERDPADYEAEGVRYDNFVPLLLNLVKRQKEQIEAMEARLSALEAQ